MTNEEVIENLKYLISDDCTDTQHDFVKEIKIAIEALEKQEPKKPRETRCALMCASCGHKITEKGCKKLNRSYCKKCGQAIDWGVSE